MRVNNPEHFHSEVYRERQAAARRRVKVTHLASADQPMLPGLELKTALSTSPTPQSPERPLEDAKSPYWWVN